MDIISILKQIGDWISLNITQKGLKLLNDSGFIVSELTAKLISILVLLFATFLAIKFLNSINAVVKWLIIVILVFLTVSIGISFI